MHKSRSSPVAIAVLGAALAALLAQPAHAQAGDSKRGAEVFASECSECHSIRAGKNKKGPSLYAIVGRKAGELPEAKYSDAMRDSGWRWDAPTLRRYLVQPRRALPGGTMKYDGLADARALEDLLAYLADLK